MSSREIRPWWAKWPIARLLCFFNRHVYIIRSNPTGIGLGFCYHCGEYVGG